MVYIGERLIDVSCSGSPPTTPAVEAPPTGLLWRVGTTPLKIIVHADILASGALRWPVVVEEQPLPATSEPHQPELQPTHPAGAPHAARLRDMLGEELAAVLVALAGPSYKPMESVLEYLAGPRVVARSEVATDIGEDID